MTAPICKSRPCVSTSEHEVWLRATCVGYAAIGWIMRGTRFPDGSKHRHGIAQLRPLRSHRFAWKRRPFTAYAMYRRPGHAF
jgi:hypothetical protein